MQSMGCEKTRIVSNDPPKKAKSLFVPGNRDAWSAAED